jgi:hypothetical protein
MTTREEAYYNSLPEDFSDPTDDDDYYRASR